MGRRKTPNERLRNQERRITASPIECVEQDFLSALFMTEYA